MIISRRNMVKMATAAAAESLALSASAGSSLVQREATGSSQLPPEDVLKFDPGGHPRPYAGNTVICHLPKSSPMFAELVRVHRDFATQTFSSNLALLPPSSYHTTIFDGANDHERKPSLWPSDIPLGAPMSECDRLLGERLKGLRFPVSLPLRFRIDSDPSSRSKDTFTIPLLPFDSDEEKKLRALRDMLSKAFQIRGPEHDRYRFHITIAYWVRRFTPKEKAKYDSAISGLLERLTEKIKVIEYQAPEYCTFTNMLAFDIYERLERFR